MVQPLSTDVPQVISPPSAASVDTMSYPPTPQIASSFNGRNEVPTVDKVAQAHLKAVRRSKFEKVFDDIRDELIHHLKGEGMPEEAVEWFRRNLQYNVPGGKLNRGLSVIDTCRVLLQRELSEDEEWKAGVLGWCVELLQAYFLVADDVMDSSVTRRGQPCYYRLGATNVQVPNPDGSLKNVKLPPVSTIALNDSLMLEGALYHLLKRYFRKERWYVDVIELFFETTYQTEIGQLIDLITAPEDDVDLTRFSLEKHRLIVLYKTAFYSFYLPVALAMHVCGVASPHSYVSLVNSQQSGITAEVSPALSFHSYNSSTSSSPTSKFGAPLSSTLKAPRSNGAIASLEPIEGREGKRRKVDHENGASSYDPYAIALAILLPLGEYFQVQDDYLDAFGTPQQIGKVGTDIVDNKCSWVVCTALAHATPAQREVLEQNYGVRPTDAEKAKVKNGEREIGYLGEAERRVKDLYDEMKIKEKYKAYEEKAVSEIRRMIEQVDESKGLKKEVFSGFLEKIYGRTK